LCKRIIGKLSGRQGGRSQVMGKAVLLIVGLLTFSSCWRRAEVYPIWFFHPPSDPEYLYAVGTAEASDLPLAYLMASVEARADLAGMLESQVSAESEHNTESAVTVSVVSSQDLAHSQVESVRLGADGQVFVLLSVPMKGRDEALSDLSIGERGMVGVGIGFETRLKDGRTIDARTAAMWSARLDLSQALWSGVKSLRREFTESARAELDRGLEEVNSRAPYHSYSRSVILMTRVIPAELTEAPTFQDLANGAVEARIRLKQEFGKGQSVAQLEGLQSPGMAKLRSEESTTDGLIRWFNYVGPEYSVSLSQAEGEEISDWSWRSPPPMKTRVEAWVQMYNVSIADALPDTTSPTITITGPADTRGLKRRTTDTRRETIWVAGRAADESGVYRVLVNGVDAVLAEDGTFRTEVLVALGKNTIRVEAIDTRLNSSVVTFAVHRTYSSETLIGGRYVALIIGIDAYAGEWSPLQNAVRDATALAELLRSDFRFDEILTLYDGEATRMAIIQQLEYLSREVRAEDNLLIYFSGHGEFKRQLNKGFWVPVDAQTESVSGFISNSDIRTFLGGIPSKHTLLIADACWAGEIFRGVPDTVPVDAGDNYHREVYRRRSRQAMTSGGSEPVTDGGEDGHSVFAYYLLKEMREMEEEIFDAAALFNNFKIAVANNSEQTPILQPVIDTGDEGGQFLFIRR
jgi:hypothetical protein